MGDDNLATADTTADNAINSAIDGIASHIPGGSAMDGALKTGVDLVANNAMSGELAKVEGMFGQHPAEAAAPAEPAAAPADAN